MRRSLGTAVLFGMLGVTCFGLLFTPAFYTFIRNFGRNRKERELSQAALKVTAIVLAFSLFAGGCAVGPRFVKPPTNLAPFHNLPRARAAKPEFSAPPLHTLWTGFNDPMLVTVVQRALDQNLDLAAAFARVRQARAAAAAAGAQLLPTADLEATGTAVHQSVVNEFGSAANGFPGYRRDQREYTVGAAASWEIDLSGGLRRGKAAAADELQAAQAEQVGTRITVAADPTSSRASAGLPRRTSELALRSRTTTRRSRFPARLVSTASTGALFSTGRRSSPPGRERSDGACSILERSQPKSRNRAARMPKRLQSIGRRP